MAVAKSKQKKISRRTGVKTARKKMTSTKLAARRNSRPQPRYVYPFGGGTARGNAGMRNLLGGKGANLAEMARLGLPVPAGFTITTRVCTAYYENRRRYPRELAGQVERAIKHVEKVMGAKFGDRDNPLLVSVRSGARVSMPGMMDTVLNLGLNDETVRGLIAKTGNERFAYDCYRRFVQMYGDVVLGLRPESKDDVDPFEEILEHKKRTLGIEYDTELSATDLEDLVLQFKQAIKMKVGHDFPEDPKEQLWGAIGAVFGSWMNERAVAYRRIEGIPDEWGTAVNVQSMVFGNTGENSATGVAFTRNPATGENLFYGEWLQNAQGEDVVAGTRTPNPLNLATKTDDNKDSLSLEEFLPDVYRALDEIRTKLENHYRDMQDVEFTIEEGRLWMLQTRTGKRNGPAAIRMAADMANEGLISHAERPVSLLISESVL